MWYLIPEVCNENAFFLSGDLTPVTRPTFVLLSWETTKSAVVIKLHDCKLCFSVETLLTKKSLLNLRVLSPVALWRHTNSRHRSHAH